MGEIKRTAKLGQMVSPTFLSSPPAPSLVVSSSLEGFELGSWSRYLTSFSLLRLTFCPFSVIHHTSRSFPAPSPSPFLRSAMLQNACKIMAKDLVRTRRYIQKFYAMRTQLQAVSLRIQTLRSNQQMGEAMKGATKAMGMMNRQMNLPQVSTGSRGGSVLVLGWSATK